MSLFFVLRYNHPSARGKGEPVQSATIDCISRRNLKILKGFPHPVCLNKGRSCVSFIPANSQGQES